MFDKKLDNEYIHVNEPQNLTNQSLSINDSRTQSNESKQSRPAVWEEQSNYAAMNHNKRDGKCQKCRHCSKKPKCCNCCMCGIICLHIIAIFVCLILIIVYAVVPAINNIVPEIQNVYIQLFDYGIGEDHWIDINNHTVLTKFYMNATGAFAVQAKNHNFAGFYMHDWSLDAISLNLYQNPVTYI